MTGSEDTPSDRLKADTASVAGPQGNPPDLQALTVREALALAARFYSEGALAKAGTVCQQILKSAADQPDALHLLGLIAFRKGVAETALQHMSRAIAVNPHFAEAHHNLGLVHMQLGQWNEAGACYSKALLIDPDYADAHKHMGALLRTLGRPQQALDSYRKSVALQPGDAPTLCNMAALQTELNRLDEAIDSYRKALSLDAGLAEAHYNLGSLYRDMGRPDDAVAHNRKALQLQPDSFRFLLAAHLFVPIMIASVAEIDRWRAAYEDGLAILHAHVPVQTRSVEALNFHKFYLSYHNKSDLAFNASLSRLLRKHFSPLNRTSPDLATWTPPERGSRRIRIGFLSEYLKDHTIGRLNIGLIQHLDRRLFEVVVIHTPDTPEDTFRQAIDQAADTCLSLPHGLEKQQDAVSAASLDVLYYTDIGMSSSTYLLAHARLAPVQAVCWGHPDTTGIDTVDYFVSAASIEQEHAEAHYSERLIRLNRLPCFYNPPESLAIRLTREDLGLPETGTLYGCPQTLYKFHPDFDAILADIATGDPEGWIVLLEGRISCWSDLLRSRWKTTAPALLDRVVFLPLMPIERYLALVQQIDVLLDPVHYGGGNTMYEAMALGVPMVTWRGQFMRARIAAAAYVQMGLDEPPIADTLQDYAPLALRLGHDPAYRRAVQQAISANRDRELFSDAQAVREFEDFFVDAVEAAGQGRTLPADWQPRSPPA